MAATKTLYRIERVSPEAGPVEIVLGNFPNVYAARHTAERIAARLNVNRDWTEFQLIHGQQPRYEVRKIDASEVRPGDRVEMA